MNIYDIAQKAGVSIATVSRVLNGSEKVRPATRQRIEQIIRDSHFIPTDPHNKRRRTGLIAFITSSFRSPDLVKMTDSLCKSFAEQSCHMILECTDNDFDRLHQIIEHLLPLCDVFVIDAGSFPEWPQSERNYLIRTARHTQMVLLNLRIDAPGIYCLQNDYKNSLAEHIQSLLSKGNDHIFYLFSSLSCVNLETLKIYRECFAKSEREPAAECVKLCEGAYAANQYLLGLPQEIRQPSAVFVTGEDMALAVENAIWSGCQTYVPVYPIIEFQSNFQKILHDTLLSILDKKEAPSFITINSEISELYE